ncbi:MAG: hypothetical protein JAY90_13765 [Candidatus Thiodiazotropha lotti]|nr:hypothetical protein [Candidatus Thiodiazotropha lotti]
MLFGMLIFILNSVINVSSYIDAIVDATISLAAPVILLVIFADKILDTKLERFRRKISDDICMHYDVDTYLAWLKKKSKGRRGKSILVLLPVVIFLSLHVHLVFVHKVSINNNLKQYSEIYDTILVLDTAQRKLRTGGLGLSDIERIGGIFETKTKKITAVVYVVTLLIVISMSWIAFEITFLRLPYKNIASHVIYRYLVKHIKRQQLNKIIDAN